MEKKIKINFKKIFAIFMLIVLLQNYALILGNVAIAIEHEIFDLDVSGNSDFMQITQEKQDEQVEETTRRRSEVRRE